MKGQLFVTVKVLPCANGKGIESNTGMKCSIKLLNTLIFARFPVASFESVSSRGFSSVASLVESRTPANRGDDGGW